MAEHQFCVFYVREGVERGGLTQAYREAFPQYATAHKRVVGCRAKNLLRRPEAKVEVEHQRQLMEAEKEQFDTEIARASFDKAKALSDLESASFVMLHRLILVHAQQLAPDKDGNYPAKAPSSLAASKAAELGMRVTNNFQSAGPTVSIDLGGRDAEELEARIRKAAEERGIGLPDPPLGNPGGKA